MEHQTQSIRFNNGERYERYMGKWSQAAGEHFLDWLAPPSGAHWLDVGCGNGAFTELLIGRCDPARVEGVDPSEEQLAYARTRPVLRAAEFRQGDAQALPWPDAAVEVAVMPLVIFFLADPARGVAELRRVVRPGGLVAAYAWDMPGGGFPYEVLLSELRALGKTVPEPPSPDASRREVLDALWADAGLIDVATEVIEVTRRFDDFEDFWETAQGAPSVGSTLASMSDKEVATLRAQIHARLPSAADGSITYAARAHAVKGRVPA